MALVWGPEFTTIYNDGFRPILGDKPEALGRSFRDIWSEAWKTIGPIAARAYAGEATFIENFPLTIERASRSEQAYFTFSYSPVRRADGTVAGMIDTVIETTSRVNADRALQESDDRQTFLLDLSDTLRPLAAARAITSAAAEAAARHLGLAQIGFAEVDSAREFVHALPGWNNGRVPDLLQGRHPLSAFGQAGEELRGGRELVVEEVPLDKSALVPLSSDAALSVRAVACIPLVKGGRLVACLLANHDRPRPWPANDVRLLRDVADRTWMALERARAEARLRESEERHRLAVAVGHLGTWDWNLKTGRLVWSDDHYRMLGYEVGEVEPSFETWIDRVHPDDRAATLAAFHEARDRQADYVQDYRTVFPDGTIRWTTARGRFFYDAEGQPTRMVGVMVDATERRRWGETQAVLVAELQHRTRNLMGVVRLIFEKTLRNAANPTDFTETFRDRLSALARVQGLLSRLHGSDRIAFDELIRSELSAMGALGSEGRGERVTMDGPTGVRLRSSTLQTFALALHELATNSGKYGALSPHQPTGDLLVRWRLLLDDDGPRLRVDWIETGGAMSEHGSPPIGTGFGRELIERALPYQLGARTSYAVGPNGVRCSIEMRVSERTDVTEVQDN